MKTKSAEKRGYLRLNSVFPVKYQLIKAPRGESVWHQGFTGNVSNGGICLEFSDVDRDISSFKQSPGGPAEFKNQHPGLWPSGFGPCQGKLV